MLLNYVCRVAGQPAVKLNDEAREFRWVSLTRALRMDLNHPKRLLVRTVMKRRRGAGRSHPARWPDA